MAEPLARDASGPALPINYATAKTVFGVAWKLGIALWFVFQFYSSQTALQGTTKGLDARIIRLETTANEQDRKLILQGGEIESLKTILRMQAEFDAQMRGRR